MSDEHLIRTEAELVAVLGEASPVAAAKIAPELDAMSRDFIANSPLLLLATADAEGRLDVSPKGDAPGFVAIQDDRTLLIPERRGNRMALGFRNLLTSGRIGLIFLLPGVRETLRINGRAEISRDPELLERLAAGGKPALLATRVHIEECFLHCGKALIRSRLWQADGWGTAPEIGFGRQFREKRVELPMTPAQLDEAIEQDYRDGLY